MIARLVPVECCGKDAESVLDLGDHLEAFRQQVDPVVAPNLGVNGRDEDPRRLERLNLLPIHVETVVGLPRFIEVGTFESAGGPNPYYLIRFGFELHPTPVKPLPKCFGS